MEQKEIRYGGYSTQPADYGAPDGQLSIALNAINEDGALKPLLEPKKLLEVPVGMAIVHVHNNHSYGHYILRATTMVEVSSGSEDEVTRLKREMESKIAEEIQNAKAEADAPVSHPSLWDEERKKWESYGTERYIELMRGIYGQDYQLPADEKKEVDEEAIRKRIEAEYEPKIKEASETQKNTIDVLYWMDKTGKFSSDANHKLSLSEDNKPVRISSVSSIGNTLIVLTSTGLPYYFLWKNGTYNKLGSRIPTPSVSFGLLGEPTLYSKTKEGGKERGTVDLELPDSSVWMCNYGELTVGVRDTVTESVMARLNSFLKEQSIDSGRFALPFFIRYALRLYDGSLVCHSAPVLMFPGRGPVVLMTNNYRNIHTVDYFLWETETKSDRIKYDIMMMPSDITYSVLKTDDNKELLAGWSDIVKSIDVFISKPLYSWKQDGKIEKFEDDFNGTFNQRFLGGISMYNSVKKQVRSNPGVEIINEEYAAFGDRYVKWSGKQGELDEIIFRGSHDSREASSGTLLSEDSIPSGFVTLPKFETDGIEKLKENADEPVAFAGRYGEWSYYTIYNLFLGTWSYGDPFRYFYCFKLPESDEQRLTEEIEDNSQFYILHSFSLEDIELSDIDKRKKIKVPKDYLDSLVTREVMTDDYRSNDTIMPAGGVEYNNRINYYGISRQLFKGFSPDAMLTYLNAQDSVSMWLQKFKVWSNAARTSSEISSYRMVSFAEKNGISSVSYARTLIEEEGNQYYVRSDASQPFKLFDSASKYSVTGINSLATRGPLFLFYPSINAKTMMITREPTGKNTRLGDDGNAKRMQVKLKQHPFLNGSYVYIPSDGGVSLYAGRWPSTMTDTHIQGKRNPIKLPNKIYTTEVNNPFYIPVTNINTIGVGEISKIAAATKALSQGQFGQFPLYAFSTDGVWALEVSDTGTYKAKQPVTRDVCINPDSITQLDNYVLFATDRGIMMLQGSDTTCITDSLETKDVFNVTNLPHYEKILEAAGIDDVTGIEIVEFSEYIKGCKMVYDYKSQHIVVYNPKYKYSYVYSMKSKLWGMQLLQLSATINDYPNALAVDIDNNLVDLADTPDGVTSAKGLIVTRPFTLDMPDVLKTINTVIQRGKVRFLQQHVKQVLYGSRDLYNWHAIGSSNIHLLRNLGGTPYKYFRLALVLDMQEDERLAGCTVGFTRRLTNKIR